MTAPCTVPGLLVLLPYLVGFHLEDSLVVVALVDHRVDLIERVDLPDHGRLDDLTTARLVVALHRRRPSALVVVTYGDRDDTIALTALVEAVQHVGPVATVAMVRHGEWRELTEASWSPLPDAADVPMVAEYVGRGVRPLEDRDALRAALTPTMAEADRLHEAVARHGRPSLADGLAAWSVLLAGDSPTDHGAEVVTALAFLREVADRDVLISLLVPMPTSGTGVGVAPAEPRSPWPSVTMWPATCALPETRSGTRAVLTHLARVAPPMVRPAALSVLALWAWDAGDGATASIAADLALSTDPTYTLAALVSRMVRDDVRPPAAGGARRAVGA